MCADVFLRRRPGGVPAAARRRPGGVRAAAARRRPGGGPAVVSGQMCGGRKSAACPATRDELGASGERVDVQESAGGTGSPDKTRMAMSKHNSASPERSAVSLCVVFSLRPLEVGSPGHAESRRVVGCELRDEQVQVQVQKVISPSDQRSSDPLGFLSCGR
ncbi:unnamed protein product [Merluccius merluccius]